MKCPIDTCLNNIEPCCGIIEITKKPPIDKYHCSYYRDNKTKKKRWENIVIKEKEDKKE
jgi:hypothetical protein